jgi:IS605 OrfB family transposase
MILTKTIKIKLDLEATKLLPTILAYTDSFNYVSQIGFSKKKSHSIDLHNLTYSYVRNTFSLPSQLACSSRNKASEALNGLRKKNWKICPHSKQQSIRYDLRSYSIDLNKEEVSLLTLTGRLKCKLILSNYSREYFQYWKRKSAELVILKNKPYLNIIFEKDITDIPTNNTFVGLDRGISNIAVLSNNKFFTGKYVKKICFYYRNLRRKLQLVNTKSAKRHLRKISKKEKRFKADINHQISKQIIESLNPGDTLVLEDLKGIRNQRLRKTVRILINNWNFFQLEQFITYKANAKGICVVKVPAKYTSQTCSRCGYCKRNNRKDQSHFECRECGFRINADLNASRNIRDKAISFYKKEIGVEVNQPDVSVL